MWCQHNNLSLKVIKTKEMIVDYRKRRTEHTSIRMIEILIITSECDVIYTTTTSETWPGGARITTYPST